MENVVETRWLDLQKVEAECAQLREENELLKRKLMNKAIEIGAFKGLIAGAVGWEFGEFNADSIAWAGLTPEFLAQKLRQMTERGRV
jgi:hypothetical protein